MASKSIFSKETVLPKNRKEGEKNIGYLVVKFSQILDFSFFICTIIITTTTSSEEKWEEGKWET